MTATAIHSRKPLPSAVAAEPPGPHAGSVVTTRALP